MYVCVSWGTRLKHTAAVDKPGKQAVYRSAAATSVDFRRPRAFKNWWQGGGGSEGGGRGT